MNFPIPSFFKIRLYALIIGFLILCFLLGAARHVLAAIPPAGSVVSYNGTNYILGTCVPSGSTCEDPGIPTQFPETYTYNGLWLAPVHEGLPGCSFVSWQETLYFCPYTGTTTDPPTYPAPCQSARDALATQCGGEQYITNWSSVTCTGDCLCSPSQSDLDYCASINKTFLYWDTEACQPICEECEYTQAQIQQACPAGLDYFDNISCTPVCRDCNGSEYQSCSQSCASKGGIYRYDCNQPVDDQGNPSGPPQSICVCNDDTIKTPPPETPPPDDPPDITDPPVTPPDITDDPPDGDPGDSNPPPDGSNDNALLGNIAENAKRIADNTKRIGDINQTEFNKANATLNDISNKQGVNNQWLNAIEDNTRGIEAQTKGINNRLDETNDRLEKINDTLDKKYGTLTGPDFTQPYDVGQEFDFGDRLTGFFDNVQNSGVFALPGQFFNSLPSGGSSTYTFDAGSYGVQSIDLADYSAGILILRTVTLICFCFLSIRVLVLKR